MPLPAGHQTAPCLGQQSLLCLHPLPAARPPASSAVRPPPAVVSVPRAQAAEVPGEAEGAAAWGEPGQTWESPRTLRTSTHPSYCPRPRLACPRWMCPLPEGPCHWPGCTPLAHLAPPCLPLLPPPLTQLLRPLLLPSGPPFPCLRPPSRLPRVQPPPTHCPVPPQLLPDLPCHCHPSSPTARTPHHCWTEQPPGWLHSGLMPGPGPAPGPAWHRSWLATPLRPRP